MKKLKAAVFTGTFLLAFLTTNARANQWKYEGVPIEERNVEVKTQENENKKRIKKRKEEYLIRVEFVKPEVQTKDTLITVPIEETKRKEIPFWLGIGLMGLGALGIAGVGVSIAYRIKNRRFEKDEPEFFIKSEYIDWRFYVEYPWRVKLMSSVFTASVGMAGAMYFLSNSSEKTVRNVEQTAQVVVEPDPFIMEKDSSGAHFIVHNEAGWDSTLAYLREIDTSGRSIKIIFSGQVDSSRIFDAKGVLPNSQVSIQ
ncbi:MAG: hypothetical protein QXL47_02800 [Candidatus Anstonellales archaeon]